jgi:ribonuclease HI
MRRLYITVAIPKITYGADVWYTPPRLLIGKRFRTGSVGTLKELEKAQRIATLAINGTLRSTASDTLDAHAGLLPMGLLLEKICYRGLIHICTRPETHPLHEIVRNSSDNPARTQPTPIHNLLRIFNDVIPQHMELIEPIGHHPNHQNPFIVNIPESREASMESECTDEAELKIFIDGSGLDGKAGAAAVMYRKGRENPEKVLRYHLGTLDRHTNYEAEAVGLLLALWLLRNQHIVGRIPISIYVDSQALLRAIKTAAPRPGQHLIKAILQLAGQLNRSENRTMLQIKWISSHSGVNGNERADEEAKRAAQGESSPLHLLPPLLRNSLPYSATAMKQDRLKALKAEWQENWKASPRYRKVSRFDEVLPMKTFVKCRDNLSRAQASILFQLRTEHIPLNKYLHRIKRSETDKCPSCLQIPGQLRKETVQHLLFECRAYRTQRHQLERKLGRNARDLKTIFRNKEHTKALLQFVSQTGRLSIHPS